MTFPSISVPFLISAAFSLLLAFYAWQRRATVGTRAFAAFMVSAAVYSLGYSLELASQDLDAALFWNRVQYLGILMFPTMYLVFVIEYIGGRTWLTARRLGLLFALPIVFFIIKLFDSSLHWIYASVDYSIVSSALLLSFERGPVYLLIAAFQLIVVTLANVLLIQKWNFSSSLYKMQTGIILVAAVIPYFAYIAYLWDYEPFPSLRGIDFNPLAYAIWAIIIGYAVFRFRLLDLAPVARDALIEMLSDGVLVLDTQARLVDANPMALAIFSWKPAPLGQRVTQHLGQIVDPQILIDLRVPTKSELARDSKFYEVSVSVLGEPSGTRLGYLVVLHDVSAQKAAEKELQELSLQDELTSLNNRRGFNVLASQILSVAQRIELDAALFYIDVDSLKQINDTFGHAVGDQAIVDVANILRASFRVSDVIARIGGDEFVALAFESAENSASIMQQRLQQNLDGHAELRRSFRLSFSAGLARYSWRDPKPVTALLDEADRAMYQIKQSKKSRLAA